MHLFYYYLLFLLFCFYFRFLFVSLRQGLSVALAVLELLIQQNNKQNKTKSPSWSTKTEPIERCIIGRCDSLGFWRHKLRFFLGKERPCTAVTLWQERSFCLGERLHWTKGNFGFVWGCWIRNLRLIFWVEHFSKFYLLNSILKSIPLVVESILLWAEDRDHSLKCDTWDAHGSECRVLQFWRKTSCFQHAFFFSAQELDYNKIMENTLLQCTVEPSPISRLYIGPKRKACKPLHVGLPHTRYILTSEPFSTLSIFPAFLKLLFQA